MVVSCKTCSRAINKKYPGVKCSKCVTLYHAMCANVSDDQLAVLQIDDSIVWCCKKCRTDDLILSSQLDFNVDQPGDSQNSITKDDLLRIVNGIKSDILQELNSKFDKLLESVTFCSNKITDFEIKLKETNDKLKLLEGYKKENEDLKCKVADLDTKVHDLEQYSRLNNVIISNMPETTSEDVFEVVSEIGTKIGVNLDGRDIDMTHRLPNRNNSGSNNSRNIVVKFTTRRVKEKFLTAYRQNKNVIKNIYLNEHLSQRNNELFKTARDILRPKNFKFIWTRNCKIFVRKDDTSRIKLISCEEDIHRLY